MGMNFQSYPPDDKVSLRTPNVWSLRASELGTVGRRVASRGAEVAEIAGSPRRVVIVVARNGPGPASEPPPGRAVARRVLVARPVGVGIVAQREHRAGDRVEQVRGE